ncbi:hypothetical protein SAMN04489730_4026 [Amycolatopsis australiensis]|uniref:Uncharacterized protein n=1 Tax=Amycolatopsis australiensis TaxID=546364 RepID=A0A1K1RV70_9PSEU|nr:hypothetical protein SAMN04489730_4026 [Amycolatopsis australiensis]
MAPSAVPPSRFPHATRAAVHELLLAELRSAGGRARAAGCPREVVLEVLSTRVCTATGDGEDGQSG